MRRPTIRPGRAPALPLAARHPFTLSSTEREFDPQRGQDLARTFSHGAVADEVQHTEQPGAASTSRAEVHVLSGAHSVYQGQVLVDGLDAGVQRLLGAAQAQLGAIEDYPGPRAVGCNHAGKDFDQVDLPAPLSPTSPTTSPSRTWIEASA